MAASTEPPVPSAGSSTLPTRQLRERRAEITQSPISVMVRLGHHRHELPNAIRLRPRHEVLTVPAPVDDLYDLPWPAPPNHVEVLEAVTVLRGVLAALRAGACRPALTVFVQPDGRGHRRQSSSIPSSESQLPGGWGRSTRGHAGQARLRARPRSSPAQVQHAHRGRPAW